MCENNEDLRVIVDIWPISDLNKIENVHNHCDHQVRVVGGDDHRGLSDDPRLPLYKQVGFVI